MPFVSRNVKPIFNRLRLIDWFWNTPRNLTWSTDSTKWDRAGGLSEVMTGVSRSEASTTMTSNDM